MGYEIKLIIGKASNVKSDEREKDLTKPYDDGSGYECKKDKDGNDVLTGRTLVWFNVMAELDLCKLGYQDDQLNRLIAQSHNTAKANPKTVHEFYGTTEGNQAATEDRYGSGLWPVPIRDVLTAIAGVEDQEYRRLKWAKALLESMADDPEELQVMFWGH